jgi:phytoene synthase
MPGPRPEQTSDAAACRGLLRDGSRSFYCAAFLLPRRLRAPATALYAFCRLADDAVDQGDGVADALRQLRHRLDLIYAGHPAAIAADRAFAAVVTRHDIPRELPLALLEGFAWDACGRRYPDLNALEGYAARVAGSVGAMMALIMGARDHDALARACDLGVAMQLTNIARDVGEDARHGRLYLPLAWMREAGIDPDAWIARPVHSVALGAVIARLLRRADLLYERAAGGIAHLPGDARPGMHAARLLYAAIGGEVARRGYDAVSGRAVVPGRRKAALLAQAVLAAARTGCAAPWPALPATRFLVQAVTPRRAPAPQPPWWHLPARLARAVELFERLERRERAVA